MLHHGLPQDVSLVFVSSVNQNHTTLFPALGKISSLQSPKFSNCISVILFDVEKKTKTNRDKKCWIEGITVLKKHAVQEETTTTKVSLMFP